MFRYILNKFVVFNIFISILHIDLYAEQINPTKQEMWDNMSIEVEGWIDGIGCSIDPEIKDTVIALNLMGIETRASCEGHLDHGLSYPWIDIQIDSSELKKITDVFSDIKEQISTEEILLKTKFPNLSYNDFFYIPEGENLKNLYRKYRLITDSITQIEIKCAEPLNQLLNQFYENRMTSYDKTLIIPRDSLVRLRSIGADRQEIRSAEQQLHYLNEYREEMKAFTLFLKHKFLN